jgi:hypothetical protein
MPGPGNLLYPYVFAASFGLFLALLSLEIGVWAMKSESSLPALIAGSIGGAAWASKQDMGAVALSGLTALCILSGRRGKRIAARLTATLMGFALAGGTIFRVFQGAQSFGEMVRKNSLWPFAPISRAILINTTRQQGLHEWEGTLINMLQSAVVTALAGIAVWFVSDGVWRERKRAVFALIAGVLLTGLYWELWIRGGHFFLFSACLPALLASGILAIRRWTRDPSSRDSLTSFFGMYPGSLLLLFRVGFTGVTAGTYAGIGYILAIPIVVFLIGAISRRAAAESPRGRRHLAIVAALIAALWLVRFGRERVDTLESQWKSAVPIRSRRGTAYVNPDWRVAFPAAVEFLKEESRPGEPILVIPETKGIDFLLDRENDAFWATQGPGLDARGEKELIERWDAKPPKAIVFFENTMRFYGSGDFGTGFDVDAMSWIHRHYSLVGRVAPAAGIAVRLYRKNLS